MAKIKTLVACSLLGSAFVVVSAICETQELLSSSNSNTYFIPVGLSHMQVMFKSYASQMYGVQKTRKFKTRLTQKFQN